MIAQNEAKPPRRSHNQTPEPSQAEIAARCREIQARWGPSEWASRLVTKPAEVTVPFVEIVGGDGRSSE